MIDTDKLLAGFPEGLRAPLLASYKEIASNYREHRWEPSELNGGKFCEIVYTILQGALSGSFAAAPTKPRNMFAACQTLEQTSPDTSRVGDRSLRIMIPRALPVLYEIRNNRGVGHVGGDVDPNLMDATTVQGLASWILAELVRIFHDVSADEAQKIVNALVERTIPLVWEFDVGRRVLDANMPKADQALVLLYQTDEWVSEEDLLKWVEYSTLSMFRTRVLDPLHVSRFLEYDRKQRRAKISPLGVKRVETNLLDSKI